MRLWSGHGQALILHHTCNRGRVLVEPLKDRLLFVRTPGTQRYLGHITSWRRRLMSRNSPGREWMTLSHVGVICGMETL